MGKEVHISVVSPVYQAEEIVSELVKQLKKAIASITEDFEIILIDDYSTDKSWLKITEECNKDDRVKGIHLSRNFGQHNAIGAGLDCANGEWVVVMDCDLQDKPEEILSLYNKAKEGYEIVFARRFNRYDSYFKVKISYFFSKIFNYLSGCNHDAAIANFSIINKKVVLAYRLLKERNRDYTLLINWLGFSRATVDVKHDKRFAGKSTYDLRKLLILAVNDIIANTNKPLNLSIKAGFTISFFSFLTGIILIIARLFNIFTIEGWTSIVVSIWFICGLLMMCIGTSSIYVGKIFEESKSRPNYIIKNKKNL